jgi:hypothetical protein
MTTNAIKEEQISTDPDPTPLVKIFAGKFNRGLSDTKFSQRVREFRGSFALVSTTTPQSLTITGDSQGISICSGARKNALITIRLDFDKPGKPQIDGLFHHPLFARKVSKLLEFPVMHWTDALNKFWEKNHNYCGMPTGINVHCNDENQGHLLGKEPAEMQITGNAHDIANTFSGESVFVQSVMLGRLRAIASFEHTVVLSDVTAQMLLGER